MKNEKNNTMWSTGNLVHFGYWLINNDDYGYGLLCIHGSCLGLKIGTLLNLRWGDFILDIEYGKEAICHDVLSIEDSKRKTTQYIPLSNSIKKFTKTFFDSKFKVYDLKLDDNIYVNSKTKKVLSTTSLNRELNKLYAEFEEVVRQRTSLKLKLRPLKSNTMEIAWARDMLKKYNCTKKVFIAVSKHMGHRTVNDTINLLELEPEDNITLCYDMYNPIFEDLTTFSFFDFKKAITKYLLNDGQNMAQLTPEFIQKNSPKD